MSKVTFTCSECETDGAVESTDFETETESYESSMGIKTEYWTEIETECENPDCGNLITIMINQTEYPEGDFQPPSVNTSSGADNIDIG
ncbi:MULTISPECIES: hypothetical protein [Lonsdalea]|uniref:hypothetical protein n=1 Tax=Lonsdalea TaxID=1082702 RepID=UPI0011BDF054|nr:MULTISPECIES: hypothetical protein [Lonsdalea]